MKPDLQKFASDPAAFRESLTVPTGTGPRRFGDVMADFQRKRFASLDPALIAIARGQKPAIGRHWWEATKGASKDSDLAVALLWLLAFCPRTLQCQVGAADADQANELRKAAKAILKHNAWLGGTITIQAWSITNTRTESICEIIAADIGGSHGARPDVLILNELSHVTKHEFASNLMDNAAKMPNGLAIIATNAGIRGTWQFQWRENARTSPRWCFNQYSQPAPWLDPGELDEAARRNSASRFARLWRGVWVDGGGDALDGVAIQAAVDRTLRPLVERQPGLAFAGGLDLAVSRDHAAFVVVGKSVGHVERIEHQRPARRLPLAFRAMAELGIIDAPDEAPEVEYLEHPGSGRLRLASVQSWRPPANGQIDLSAVEAAVLDAHRRFGLTVFYDPFQCALMAQQLRRAGVRMEEVTFVGANLDAMAAQLLEQFNSRNIDLFEHPELLADLGRLNIVEKSYGHKLEATRDREGGHADRATGLALAVLGLKPIIRTSAPVVSGELVCYP